jgi:DNA polymerase I-like protein with 3'-5' exonuclease and polymerase domains
LLLGGKSTTNYLVIDTENSGALRNKAHPFDPRNKLLLLGSRSNGVSSIFNIEYDDGPYGAYLDCVREQIANVDTIVGFNLKYDLHWLRRYGIEIPRKVKVWDCQLAEFILSRQTKSYPSLEHACATRKVPLKLGTLNHYIDLGIDVDGIPLPELTEYLEGDLISTEELCLKQIDLIEQGGYWELFDLHCQDLLVLADMEWNGLKYDIEKSNGLAASTFEEEATITAELAELVTAPFPINWNSGDHISAVLYGGTITYGDKEPAGYFKTGPRAGLPKFRNVERTHAFPRLVEPLDGSGLAKEGFYSTAEDTLKSLKASGLARSIIGKILSIASVNKLRTGYFEGIPKKFEHYGWEDGIMHGQVNQCVAVTGRTSSSNPNLQNQPKDAKECFVTRYG